VKSQSFDAVKEMRLLLAFFGDAAVPHSEGIPAPAIPDPYRTLLVHNHHMTVTLERHHKSSVRVAPYQIHRNGSFYGRKLDLLVESGKVVMTGIMLFNFSFCAASVQEQIIEGKTPLGRILIEHGILREITATAFLRIAADDPLVARFKLPTVQPAYGRLATIYCDGKPAVDLLEVVVPEPDAPKDC
jgi:chorismate-pyruvate lyase